MNLEELARRTEPMAPAEARALAAAVRAEALPTPFADSVEEVARRLAEAGRWRGLVHWLSQPLWPFEPARMLYRLRDEPDLFALLMESLDDPVLGYWALGAWLQADPSAVFDERGDDWTDEGPGERLRTCVAMLTNMPEVVPREPRWRAVLERVAALEVTGDRFALSDQLVAHARAVLAAC